jgi:CubicO group peptidase (beta-lactamase class C family)
VVDGDGVLAEHEHTPGKAYRWASVTKLLTALVALDAARNGQLDLDEPAGPPGSTVRHLLAHASGLGFDDDRVLSAPETRRTYSNRGFEVLAAHVEARTGTPTAARAQQLVLGPLGMTGTTFAGSPAHGASGPIADLAALARELLHPRVLPPALVVDARTAAFPGLAGVLPGFGRQTPNDWGLGFEVRGHKDPHWTATTNAPSTFGHFGQAGSFLWVDPVAGLGCVSLCDTAFGPWAAQRWPRLSANVLAAFA